MAARSSRRTVLYLLLFCKLCGIGIFMKGFFPFKRNSPGLSLKNANGIKVGGRFDRLIIVMIDALRADFVFNNNSYMNFTKDLIDKGDTFSYLAHSNPPTVTMPRIKAITTGTIPGFIDVILNVDSKELLEDNIVSQMKASNRKILFYGDDTWVKLFPDHFSRADGTTSFFVTDYTEVDNNVTRHLKPEMERTDWHVMILHYLGLDHIGHLAGPTSPLVQPKLTEMDKIIERIYHTAVKHDKQRNISTLIVLCGDHGMSDGGSHGGSSYSETTTPLVFMSSLFQHGKGQRYNSLKVNQIDIAPTLSLLMGLSIPKNSIGILIPDLLSHHSPKQRLEALRMNSLQILEALESNRKEREVIELDLAIKFHNEWLTTNNDGTHFGTTLDSRAKRISQQYLSAMRFMTNKLTKAMSSYDNYALYIGMWLLIQSFLGTLCLHLDLIPKDLSLPSFAHFSTGLLIFFLVSGFTAYIHLHVCSMQFLGSSELFCTFSVLSIFLSGIFILSTALTLTTLIYVLISINVYGLHCWLIQKPLFLRGDISKTVIFLILGICLHTISLLSSSFIEEEHQTWYFLTTSYHVILLCVAYSKNHTTSSSDFYNVDDSPTLKNSPKENAVKNVCKNVTDKISSGEQPDCSAEQNYSRGSLFVLFVLLCCDRIMRSWNQTGIKWADQPDVGDWLVNPENKTILSYLFVITLIIISAKTYFETKKGFIVCVVFTAGGFGVYFYRSATGSVNLLPWRNQLLPEKGISFAQWVYFCVFVLVLMSIYEFLKACHKNDKDKILRNTNDHSAGELFLIGYLLLILLLLRPHNIALVALTVLQASIHHHVIWKRCRSNLEIILSAYYIGWFTYFAQGNSNSLATVDIGAGYIGLDQNYSPIFVAFLTGLTTFSGPLFWMINAVLFMKKQENSTSCSTSTVHEVCTTLLLVKSLNLTVCAIMCWLNCYHLFVWSVFSPKLLYEGVISVVFSIFILISSQTDQM